MDSPDAVAVVARGLVRHFGKLAAVDRIGFEVRRGEIFGLVGPDGAGKSTIMRMLAGVLRPDAGEIRQCDTPARLKLAMPGALLAVPAARPRDVNAALADAPGVLGRLLMGDRVNVRVDDAARRLPELRALLTARGFADAGLARIEPGIEDVFVALVGSGSAA